MLTLMEYESADVNPQVKDKIKNLLESGLSYAMEVFQQNDTIQFKYGSGDPRKL